MTEFLTIEEAATLVATVIKGGTALSFFVGAGVSKDDPSFLPDWTEFRNAMLTALINRLSVTKFLPDKETRELNNDLLGYDLRYGSRGGLWLKPEVALQWIHSYIPRTVHEMLRVFSCGNPNLNHLMLAHLAAFSGTLVATCNFDTHIERALETIGYPVLRFAGPRQVGDCQSFRDYLTFIRKPHKGQIPILKIHGCVTVPATIRATLAQVSRQVPRAQQEALRGIVSNRFLVVAGYSGRDSDIRTEFQAAAPNSKGILWLARDKESLIPEVSRIPNATIGIGDVNIFFKALSDWLNIKLYVEKGRHISVHGHIETAARRARVLPTALALSELAMHIGCRSTVEILTQQVIGSSNNPRWLALAWMSLGDSKRRQNPGDALRCFERAEAAARVLKTRDPLLYGHSLKYLAAQHYVLGSQVTALALNTKSLRWVRKSGDRASEGRILDDRANIFRQRGKIQHAINLRKMAITLLEKAGDKISLAMVYNNLGKDFDALDDFGEAEKWWRNSLEIKEKETSDSPDIGRTCFNIGELLRHTGKTEEGLPFLIRARARSRMHQDRVTEARAVHSIAAIAYSRGKTAQARRFLRLAEIKAQLAEDWRRHPSRVKWAKNIHDMITGGE